MIATVRCYYNTGLSVSNCLDTYLSLDVLGFDYKDFENIAIKQDRGLINIKISTNYENIKDADYCRINNVCYWITSIMMLNDNVADVQLQQDYLTTVGVVGLEIISGWCTRRHVVDDTLYSNTIDEPFTPSNKLEIDFGSVILGGDSDGTYPIVVSSVDLLKIDKTADKYTYLDNYFILVPNLPNAVTDTTTYKCDVVTPQKPADIACTNAFLYSNSKVQEGMRAVRQLGVESCLGAMYALPKSWATISESDGLITEIVNNHASVTSKFGGTWGNYKNNKVYTGQFQKIINFSMCSGESSEARVEDIIEPGLNIVVWSTYADCRYNGKPGCKPKYFRNVLNTATLNSISGATWDQTPLVYNESSGSLFIRQQGIIDRSRNFNNMGNSVLSSTLGGATSWANSAMNPNSFMGGKNISFTNSADVNRSASITGNAISNISGNILGGLSSIGNYFYNRQQQVLNQNMAMLDFDIKFPSSPEMADYLHNAFYDMRYRLSDNDMQRFDNFLSAYGYAVDEVLSQSCFLGRQNHNYVKANDVTLKKEGAPQYLLSGAASQIEAGVRIWHVKPSRDKLIDNPIS